MFSFKLMLFDIPKVFSFSFSTIFTFLPENYSLSMAVVGCGCSAVGDVDVVSRKIHLKNSLLVKQPPPPSPP